MKRSGANSRKTRYQKPIVLPEKFVDGGKTENKWIIWIIASLSIHFLALSGLLSQQPKPLTVDITLEKGIQSITSAYFVPIQSIPPPLSQETPVPPTQPQENIEIISTKEQESPKVETPNFERNIEKEIIEEPLAEESKSEPIHEIQPTEEAKTNHEEWTQEIPDESVSENLESMTITSTMGNNAEDLLSLPNTDSYGTETDTPNATVYPTPRYPPIAIRRGLEGTVILNVVINENGKPIHVTVIESSGYDYFDKEALSTVLNRWQFDCTHPKNNFRLKIDFRLKK